MGAAASVVVPPEFEKLSEHDQAELTKKFQELLASAKSQEEALAELVAEIKKDPFGIMPGGEIKIPLTKMLDAIEWSLKAGLTPFILDDSEDNKVDTFFSYQSASILDGKKMGLDVTIKKVPIEEVMEEARKSIVAALKFGNILCVALTQAATDFATKFNDKAEPCTSSPLDLTDGKSYLPLELFVNGGRELIKEEWLNALFRDEDKEQGFAFARDPEKFYTVVTSRFSQDDYKEFLFENDWGMPKPMEQYCFIIVRPEEELAAAAAAPGEAEATDAAAPASAAATEEAPPADGA